jgi:hypothetical protein
MSDRLSQFCMQYKVVIQVCRHNTARNKVFTFVNLYEYSQSLFLPSFEVQVMHLYVHAHEFIKLLVSICKGDINAHPLRPMSY